MIKLNRPVCPNPAALSSKNYKHPDNKLALKKSANEKCMYCESKIPHIDHADVEHIKPKAVNKFPQLEFVWENLGYACTKCNGSKSDNYDLSTPYVNPYEDDPEDHFVFVGWLLQSKQGCERGELTITDISLNRVDLVERRKERIEKLNDAIKACYRTSNPRLKAAALQSLIDEAAPNKEYSLASKFMLRSHCII